MCGIAGQFTLKTIGREPARFGQALELMTHRGPNGQGIMEIEARDASLMFGHKRLSIIDLSDAGLQPMSSADGRFTLVFNGEIYNYIELREELARAGHQFRTKTDTEVLIHAWMQWGEDCLPRLDGMFAFALFDRESGQLACARDPFGIKPFFYRLDAQSFYFASEAPALSRMIPGAARPNVQRCYDFLLWGDYDDSDDTFFEGVLHLRPGHLLTLHVDGALQARLRPWRRASIALGEPISFDDAADQFRTLFLQGVKRQLRSDVPLGVTLSGGLDSSAIVCAIRHLEPDLPIHTFSYIAPGTDVDEERWARLVIEHAGAIGHFTQGGGENFRQSLDDVVACQGEPFGSTSILASYQVFRLAHNNGVTVTLDGQGADELLAGYDGYPTALFRSFLDRRDLAGLLRFISAWSKWPRRSLKRAGLHLAEAMVPENLRALGLGLIGHSLTPDYIRADRLIAFGGAPAPVRPLPTGADGRGRRLMERLSTALTSNRLPALLRHGDRNAMRWSIESRVPFLTLPLADFVLRLPEDYLVSRQGQTKHLMRRGLRGIVPDAILDRRDKIGFETPERSLLNQEKGHIDAWLDGGERLDFIDLPALRRHVDRVLDGSLPFSFKAWRMINLCRWAATQLEGR